MGTQNTSFAIYNVPCQKENSSGLELLREQCEILTFRSSALDCVYESDFITCSSITSLFVSA